VEKHHALLDAGIWIVEGLDLSGVEPGLYELICLPLKLVGAEGAPRAPLLRSIESMRSSNESRAVFPDKRSLGILDDFPSQRSQSLAGESAHPQRGVCGTDREIASFLYGTPPEGYKLSCVSAMNASGKLGAGPKRSGLSLATWRSPWSGALCAPECTALPRGRSISAIPAITGARHHEDATVS